MEIFKNHFKDDEDIVKKISILLCMGGNDFIPKFYGISHHKMLDVFLKNEYFLSHLIFRNGTGIHQIDTQVYKDFMKTLYCPKNVRADAPYEDVRNATIFSQRKCHSEDNIAKFKSLRNGQSWLPPASALEKNGRSYKCTNNIPKYSRKSNRKASKFS